MKANKTLVFFLAILVAICAVGTVMAATGDLAVAFDEVSVDSVVTDPSATVTAGYAGETVPVQVRFAADADLDDLKVKVWIDGYKNDLSVSTDRFDVLNGTTYLRRLSLTLPNVNDMDDVNEDLTLHVRISDRNDYLEEEYNIRMQRNSYVFDVLSVEAPTSASAGDIIAVDVVLKNTGSHELEDAFVTARIPDLGVSRKVYFGDLTPEDDCDDDCAKQDARERRIYLVIPSDAVSGTYGLEVKASNYDSSQTVMRSVDVSGVSASNDSALDLDNDDDDKDGVPNSIIVLTVILVIIFLVLLIVLIALLTKKPEERMEDFGETSYY